MSVVAAIVLFAVIWFMTFLIVLPIRLKTQGDVGKVTRGTHAGAPDNPRIGQRAKIATVIAAALWAVIAGVILSGAVSVRDFDWRDVMGAPPGEDAGNG